MTRPRVLVVADYYLPGFRAGGPVRAISNTIRRLTPDADFFLVTRDHDADGSKYRDVVVGRWTESTAGRVLYVPRLTPALLQRCVADTACDVIWLNSFFSRASIGVLAYRRIGRIRRPVLLAPRGEFASSALAMKSHRKAIALWALRWTGCLPGIYWLASSEFERQDIHQMVGSQRVSCVPESVAEMPESDEGWGVKSEFQLRAVFASRIAPMKNLLFLLEVLSRCRGDIHLDIIGPPEDATYWATCRAAIERLPSNVKVAYAGETTHHDLQRRLSAYDLMILPTHGESFGHIIVEAWAAGCPVLISDRTPWRGLREQGVGWDVPLEHNAWTAALGECLALGPEAHRALRRRAGARARRVWEDGVAGAESLHRLIDEVAGGLTPERSRRSDPVVDISRTNDTEPCA